MAKLITNRLVRKKLGTLNYQWSISANIIKQSKSKTILLSEVLFHVNPALQWEEAEDGAKEGSKVKRSE